MPAIWCDPSRSIDQGWGRAMNRLLRAQGDREVESRLATPLDAEQDGFASLGARFSDCGLQIGRGFDCRIIGAQDDIASLDPSLPCTRSRIDQRNHHSL